MLQIAATETKIPPTLIKSNAETPLSRIIRACEETVVAINGQELVIGGTAIDIALYNQLDALFDEASCHLPQTEREAIFQLLLAGGETQNVLDGTTRKIRKDSAERQTALIVAALSFFEEHKKNLTETWGYTAYPLSCVTSKGGN